MENIFNIKGKIEVVNISGMEETIHNAYENYLRNKKNLPTTQYDEEAQIEIVEHDAL